MKNKLILSLSFIAIVTPTTYTCAQDSYWERVINYFFGEQDDSLPQSPTPQTPLHRPQQPSAPPYELPSYSQQQNQPTITYAERERVKNDAGEIIDRLFATRKQDPKTQREIYTIKTEILTYISASTLNCRNMQELRNATNYYLVEYLALYVAKKARSLYEDKAAKALGQPAYSPSYLAQQIEDEFKANALKAIKHNEPGSLAYYVGQALEQEVAKKVARDYPAQKPAPVVAPNPADNIYEVYPHSNSERYEQTITKIQQGEVFREAECCVCSDDFGGTLKRVTLACGHSICPNCLYNWLHQQRKSTCPSCRDTIRADEFPEQYLRKYKN